jgi:arylsulfatase A-like enzyme
VLALGLASWFVATCRASPQTPGKVKAPNVLFVVLETLRKDHLELYGYRKSTAPNLTRFAESSLVFDNAVVQANWTIPSVATMFTSLYASSHKFIVQHGEASVLSPRIPTLAEVLKLHGYKTGAFQTNMFLTRASGIAQGIDDYERKDAVAADHVVAGAIRWLQENQEAPFFLYLHFWDPHAPYTPPPGLEQKFMEDEKDIAPESFFAELYEHIFLYENGTLIRDLNRYRASYDASIWSMDYEIRKLLQYLDGQGLTNNTLIVFVADHGEEFGDHGGLDHGYNLYEYMVGVPLIVRFPEGHAGRVGARVGAIDLAPTILDYLGIEAPPMYQGRSFLHLAENPGGKHKPLEFCQGNGVGNVKEHRFGLDIEQQCVYEGRYKLIRSSPTGTIELYDLIEDRREQHNLASSKPAVVRKLIADLDAFLKYAEENSVNPEEKIHLDEEELEKLKALGYAGGQKSK